MGSPREDESTSSSGRGSKGSWGTKGSASTLPSSLDARLTKGASGATFCIAAWAQAPETRSGDRSPPDLGEEGESDMSIEVVKISQGKFLHLIKF